MTTRSTVRIIECDSPESGDGAVSKAWRFVSQTVDSENVASLVEGLNRLRVVTIGLEGRDDAQQIFESLNATGEPLTEGEKVKNWLLMGLSEEVQNDLHDEYWLAVEKALVRTSRRGPDRPVSARLDAVAQRGRLVERDLTYDEFRRWAIRAGRDDPIRRPGLCSELASLAVVVRPTDWHVRRSWPSAGCRVTPWPPARDGGPFPPPLHPSPSLGRAARRGARSERCRGWFRPCAR